MTVIIMSYFVFRSQETILAMRAQTPLYDSSQNERRMLTKFALFCNSVIHTKHIAYVLHRDILRACCETTW